MTLGIYSVVLFFVLCIVLIKKLPQNIGIIINITIWYTVLNFANVFPWLSFGNMNWTGKLLVIFIVAIIAIYKKTKNEEGFIGFVFDKGNKNIIIITSIIYLVIGSAVLILLLAYGKFNIERYLMNIFLVGISEELCFRGFIYKELSAFDRQRIRKCVPIIICSIAFAMTHLYFFQITFSQNVINFLPPFALGLLINIIYNKSKNILVPILIHNSVDTLYYGVSTLLQMFVFYLGGGGV
jgi:membrane protease YdiL (CAAX protease family)